MVLMTDMISFSRVLVLCRQISALNRFTNHMKAILFRQKLFVIITMKFLSILIIRYTS